jgi:hypothetical protein
MPNQGSEKLTAKNIYNELRTCNRGIADIIKLVKDLTNVIESTRSRDTVSTSSTSSSS